MFKLKLFNVSTCPLLLLATKRLLHHKSDAIVIASAVRTPWGKFQGQLSSMSAWQLGQLAVETAVKQAAVPLEDVKQIIMYEIPLVQKESDNIFSSFFKKSKYTAIKAKNGVPVTSLLKALEVVKFEPDTIVVNGIMESASKQKTLSNHQLGHTESELDVLANTSYEYFKKYIAYSNAKFLKAQQEGLFEAELIPLNVQQQEGRRKVLREVKQDELYCDYFKDQMHSLGSDGASALVLTTRSKAQTLNLSPLAEIINFECLTNAENIFETICQCITTLTSKSQIAINHIHHWEIDDHSPELVEHLQQHFNLKKELVNPHGGLAITGCTSKASFYRQLTHLSHALKPYEYGCIVSFSSRETFGLIIKKLPALYYADRLPLITLYTKDPCPLCDDLVEQLELNFSGEYELQKVFIDTKENVRYLRLYRWDIPVVFLNNQFLCMHRLNHNLLRQNLDILKNHTNLLQ